MSQRPAIILPANKSASPLLRSADGQIRDFSAAAIKGQSVDLIIAGQNVRIHAHELPKMREREKHAAARFAIEDRMGASLDAQHIVISSGEDKRLAVIDAAVLRGFITTYENQNIQIGDIYADFDWLAPQKEPVIFSDRIVFTGPEGYTIDSHWAEDDLSAISPSGWEALPLNANALSLRRGEFARRSRIQLPAASLIKIAAVLTVTGLSWLALQGAQSRAISQQAKALQSQTSALYAQATGKPAPANPALAITRAVKNGAVASSDFIPLMSAFNAALGQTSGIAVQTVSFEDKSPQLKLLLIYPSFESAGELEAAARTAGHVFRAGGVREQNGILTGDAVFEIGGPS